MHGPQKICKAAPAATTAILCMAPRKHAEHIVLGVSVAEASGADLLRKSLLSASSSIELTDLVRSAVRVLPSGCGSWRVLQYCSHCSRFHLGASSRPSAPAITACTSRHHAHVKCSFATLGLAPILQPLQQIPSRDLLPPISTHYDCLQHDRKALSVINSFHLCAPILQPPQNPPWGILLGVGTCYECLHQQAFLLPGE